MTHDALPPLSDHNPYLAPATGGPSVAPDPHEPVGELTVTEVFRRSFELYARCAPVLLAATGIVALPTLVGTFLRIGGAQPVINLLEGGLYCWAVGVIIFTISQQHAEGVRVSLANAFSTGRKLMLSLLWIAILYGFCFAVPIVGVSFLAAAITFGAFELQILLMVLVGVWGVYFTIRYSLCFQAAVIHEERGFSALQASHRLIHRRGGGLLGSHAARAVLVFVVLAILSLTLQWSRTLIMRMLLTVIPGHVLWMSVGPLVTAGVSVLTLPVIPCVLTVFYHDLVHRNAIRR